MDAVRDERKSAELAARCLHVADDARRVTSFAETRECLRHTDLLQDGAGADEVDVGNPEHVPVFYLDGKAHKQRRAAIARFFTPKAIATRYQALMEETTARLLGAFRQKGRARLDRMSFELTVAVASDIVGLTETEVPDMAPRLDNLLRTSFSNATGLARLRTKIMRSWYGYLFYVKDVRPAVRARRKQRGDDIISQCLEKGYSDKAIVIECMTYATAGMVTTREFIVMVAWHLFDNPDLRADFMAGDEDRQMAILLEILRLEPIGAVLYRRADEATEGKALGAIPAGERLGVDLRAANVDEEAVGPCPYAVDPERATKQGRKGEFMSFGDGAHHCPGWQVALHESRVFIERLMQVPGIAMVREPDIIWNELLMSYELRNAVVTCDTA